MLRGRLRAVGGGVGLAVVVAVQNAAAQDARPAAGPGFIVARYATRSSLAVYGGYALGAGFAVVGLLQNPRTGYRAAMVGGGVHSLRGLTVALTAANTSDGWFAQLHLFPYLQAGRFTVEGAVDVYQPLERRGVQELELSPAQATVRVFRGIGVGGAYYWSASAREPAHHAAGPALKITIPGGSFTLELLRGIANASSEMRLSVRTSR